MTSLKKSMFIFTIYLFTPPICFAAWTEKCDQVVKIYSEVFNLINMLDEEQKRGKTADQITSIKALEILPKSASLTKHIIEIEKCDIKMMEIKLDLYSNKNNAK